jgi:hypothetical protein
MQPKFNADFTKLVFFGTEEPFLNHAGNYQMKCLDWPLNASQPAKTLIDLTP